MEIPLPKTGHWGKIQFNKPVEIIKLPSNYSGEKEVTLSLRKEGSSDLEDVSSPVAILQQEIENNSHLPLEVPERLTNPGKLIVAAKETLMKQKPSSFGVERGLVYTHRGELSISVSPQNVSRAIRFMDTFIKLLHERGHKVVEDNGSYVIIEDEKLEISLREKMKRVMVMGSYGYKNAEDSPTGILCFRLRERAYKTVEWKDGKLPLEKQLSKILANLEIKVKELKAEDLRIKEYWAKEKEKELIELEKKKRKEKELSGFLHLLKKAKRWRKATMLRDYIKAVETKTIESGIVSEDFKNWLLWAQKKADWFDPNIEAEDKLLEGVDKDTLTFKNKSDSYFRG